MAMIKAVTGKPDPFASFEEKKTDEYGLKIAQTISADWFNGKVIGAGCEFMNRRDYVVHKRLLVRGEQDQKPFKDHLKRGDNDLNYLNLDWAIINVVKKFARLTSNSISDDKYRLDVRATDKLSVIMKGKKQDEYRKNMAAREMLEKAVKINGIDLRPKTFVPEDEEEMKLFMEIKDRPKIEIYEEMMVDFVKRSNDWDYIRSEVNKDTVDLGIFGIRCWIDKNDGVKVAYVNPEFYVHSRVERNDFADKFYEGYVDTITLSDLRRESDFSEFELRQIAKVYASTYTSFKHNYDTCAFDQLVDLQIDVLRFAWKTSKEIKFKKKLRKGEAVKVSRRNDTYQAPDRSDVGVISKKLDTWFEGNHIIGSNAIYGYQECENLARDTMNKAQSPFVIRTVDIYQNRLKSFLTDIEPIANQLQNDLLKLQLLLAELRPDTIEIDIDQLAEIDNGKGGTKENKWKEALDIFQVKGIVLTKRLDMGESGMKDGPAVNARAASQGSAIPILLNAISFKYNMIRDITGINPAADGSLASDALLGVSEIARAATNTATKDLFQASVDWNKKVCELISTRIHSIFKHKEAAHLKEIYVNAVGKHYIDALEVLADRHLHEFGFIFEMLPTKEELDEFKADLAIALQEGSIDAEIKIEATRIAKVNVKLAIEYLLYSRRKRMKIRMEEQMALAADKSKNDSQAAMAKAQYDTQSYAQKKQIDLGYAGQLAQIEIQKAQALQAIAQPVADKEFEQEVYITQIQKSADLNVKKYLEDRKDDRKKLEGTQQAQLIDQRHKGSEPKDFQNQYSFEDII